MGVGGRDDGEEGGGVEGAGVEEVGGFCGVGKVRVSNRSVGAGTGVKSCRN